MSIVGELVGAAGSVRHSGEGGYEDHPSVPAGARRPLGSIGVVSLIIMSCLFALWGAA